MLYFMGFATDFTFGSSLKEPIRTAARDAFAVRLRRYALKKRCTPLPPGEWAGIGRTWTWTRTGPPIVGVGNPLANLDARFALYAETLQKGRPNAPRAAAA